MVCPIHRRPPMLQKQRAAGSVAPTVNVSGWERSARWGCAVSRIMQEAQPCYVCYSKNIHEHTKLLYADSDEGPISLSGACKLWSFTSAAA